MSDNTHEFKDALLKVAEELREVAQELRSESAQPEQQKEASMQKQASSEESFSMGSLGRPNPASDPLMEFCLG